MFLLGPSTMRWFDFLFVFVVVEVTTFLGWVVYVGGISMVMTFTCIGLIYIRFVWTILIMKWICRFSRFFGLLIKRVIWVSVLN